MGKLAVVDGAILMCTAGSLPTPLIATNTTLAVQGQRLASIMDHVPIANIVPFGTCTIKGSICLPVTPAPWIASTPPIRMLGGMHPVLAMQSMLPCLIGGVILILSAGQNTLMLDTPGRCGPLGPGARARGPQASPYYGPYSPELEPFDWQFGSVCGAEAAGWSGTGWGACGAAASGIGVCGADACGAAVSGVNACGAAASGASACAAAACGAAASGASACGAAASGAGVCAAAACGAAACGIDIPAFGIFNACPAEACAVNVVPIVPVI